jgi:hypothetical protein
LIFGTRQKYASQTAEKIRMTAGSAGRPGLQQTIDAGRLGLQAVWIFLYTVSGTPLKAF